MRFARDGKTLLYTVSAANSAENGVYAVTPGIVGAPVAVASGKGKYARLTWNRSDSESDLLDRSRRSSRRRRLASPCIAGRGAVQRASRSSGRRRRACPRRWSSAIAERWRFSRDGRKVYVPMAPPPRPAPSNRSPSRMNVSSSICGTGKTTSSSRCSGCAPTRSAARTYRGVYDLAAAQVRAARRPVIADGHAQRRRHARDRDGRLLRIAGWSTTTAPTTTSICWTP